MSAKKKVFFELLTYFLFFLEVRSKCSFGEKIDSSKKFSNSCWFPTSIPVGWAWVRRQKLSLFVIVNGITKYKEFTIGTSFLGTGYPQIRINLEIYFEICHTALGISNYRNHSMCVQLCIFLLYAFLFSFFCRLHSVLSFISFIHAPDINIRST